MGVEFVNRKGDTYYLHEGKSKTGKPKYHFSKKADGQLCQVVPAGFEVYENPHGQVYCRRRIESQILPIELECVTQELKAHEKDGFTLVDVKGEEIVIWESNARELAGGFAQLAGLFGRHVSEFAAGVHYHEVLKFKLVNVEDRLFAAYRWCWKGSIDDWIPLMTYPMALPELTTECIPHIGEESFFELM